MPKPSPHIRSFLLAPPTVPSPHGPALAPIVREHLDFIDRINNDMYNSLDYNKISNKISSVIQATDETTLVYFIRSIPSREMDYLRQHSTIVKDMVSRVLSDASNRGEVWNPLMSILVKEHFWVSTNSTLYANSDYKPHPSPEAWLSRHLDFINSTPVNDILSEQANFFCEEVWRPVLAAHSKDITEELVAVVTKEDIDLDSLAALISRTKDEALLTTLAEKILADAEEDGLDLKSAARSYYLPTPFCVLTKVNKQLGFMPPSIKARLSSLPQSGSSGSQKPSPTSAACLLASDPTTSVAACLDILRSGIEQDLLPILADKSDFLAIHKEEFYKNLLTVPKYHYSRTRPTLAEHFAPYGSKPFDVDPVVMADIVEDSIKKSAVPTDSSTVIMLLSHPFMTLPLLRRIASGCPLPVVRAALANHPLAATDPSIRQILTRSRSSNILLPLLTKYPSTDFLDLWQKLVKGDPSEALGLIETKQIPPDAKIPRLTIAPILKSPDKQLRERAIKISALLTGDELSNRQLKRAKNDLSKIKKPRR